MVLVFGRYVLVAPFAPSQGVMENGDLDLEQLDNDLLYLIDTKKPNSPAISKELKTWNPRSGKFNKVFYPSRVVFDPSSNNVCVRGTKFEENNDTIEAIDVIAYVNFSEDTNGKPVFDSNVVLIEIPGVTTPHTSDAPLDFAFSSAGDVLVFTNGASVFSFDLAEGFLQELNIVDPADFGDNDSISSIDLDSTTNILSICRERTPVSQTDVVTSSSDLSFYRLNQNGSFQFLKRVNGDSLAGGEALAMDSNIEIISDPGKADSELALFVTNRGSLCTVDLHEDGDSATIRRLYNYPELAQAEPGNASQLTVKYDSSTRIVGIVSSGFSIQIARPVNGKRRRIARPVNVHITSGPAVLAMAKLNKKNKLASVNSFTGDFTEEGGLSNFVRGQDAQWLISTYSGKLYSVNLADDLKDSALEFVGSLGSNVDRIDYYSDRSSIVAINSFTPDEEGIRMASRGSLVVARITESTGALVQALLPTASALTKPGASIRRPCNVRR
ncbi:MAG TPA: hypothetical protein VLM38_02020 [Blastocatellia bacterium]|nr:hypothetical protein [Blastocatellia bacterium]